MGRTTYEWVRAHMEGEDDGWAYVVPTFVFTHAELSAAEDADIRFAPVTLGAVRPLFPRRFDLELKSLERNGAFACAVYAVVGPRSN